MKDILVRSGLCGVVMLGMFSCAVSIQANDEDNARVSIQGRDVFLDGRPHIPHGMVHAANEHFPSLSKIGINSIHEDVAFRDFDPRRSDEENKAALARYLKKADEAHANGMTMLWLFSFHYTPDWLWERYPDAHAKKQDGSDGQGGWISMCLDHPGFRTDAAAWLKFVASNLGSHPATLGYLLWNEPHLTSEICYNAHTIAAFHKWLEKCYQTVETMNKAWQAQFAAFTDVKPPAPQARTRWHEVYDKMVSEQADAEAQNAPVATDNPAVSMDWLRFRQDNFAEFFAWEADVVRAADPDAVITSKIVPFDLYTSHAYGAGVNTELWERKFLDVIGMDLYSHLDEDFLARWKCDYFLSLSQGKPVWHTEFNFTFLKERGLATPEQWRTVAYYQLARGVNGFWDFMWGDGEDYTLHYNGYRFAPVTHEIARISRQLEKLAPLLVGARPAPAQVAVLHSTTSGLAVSGDYAPSADQTTIIDLLYRSHTPFEFVTEDMVRRGDLKKYRALITVGTIALPDDVLSQIRKFTDENGGHVFANARFAELDDYGRKRTQYPPAWMGVKANSLSRQPREKTGTLELRRGARSVDDNPVDVRVTMDTWSSRPIKLASGEALGSGNIFGDEDTQFEWSCGGRHEMYWEDVQAINGGKVTGTFEDGKPAIVETPQTLYIARDTCWVDENFERFFGRFLKRSGVLNRNAVTRAGTGEPVPSVDLRMWEGKDTRVLFVINSAPTLHYDGEPVDVEVTFDSFGEVTDALTGQLVPSRWRDFKRVIRLELKAGDVRVLLGKPRPASWGADQSRYNDLNEHLQPVPIGTPGILYIGGAGLALGYLKRSDLTAEKFIQNPFSENPEDKIYNTGDMARYLPDGRIIHLGRIDHQVKIRGFRIELGEIESVLNKHEQVKEVIVVAREDQPGNKQLAAYITPKKEEKAPELGELREFLKAKLPDYMVPAAFVILDAIPLTPNGKIDRKALPAPDFDLSRLNEFVAPRNKTEETLAQIWTEVLGL
ncbi:MAG: AMP-binding protein, partial [Verrucomicrobia bacterium]|nr:AMP-binding protein [Verrucomicrobiota bacterium]